MAELTWQDNSKAMFDKMIEASPKPFRAMTEKKLMEAVVAKAGDGGKGADGDRKTVTVEKGSITEKALAVGQIQPRQLAVLHVRSRQIVRQCGLHDLAALVHPVASGQETHGARSAHRDRTGDKEGEAGGICRGRDHTGRI